MFVIIAGTVAILLFVYWYRRPSNFPDGPRGIPIFGTNLSIGNQTFGVVFTEYQKTYGSILSVRVGSEDWVVLNKFDDLHEAFVRRADVFSGRQSIPMFNRLTNGKGLAFLEYGHTWNVQRKFGLRMLRGSAIERKEYVISEESSYLANEFMKMGSTPVDPNPILFNALFNVRTKIFADKRFDYDDEKFKTLIDIAKNSFSGSQGKYLGLIQFAFWMRHLPGLRDAYDKFLTNARFFMAQFLELAEEHEKTYNENKQRDFIDGFIGEMRAKSDPSFEFQQLVQYIRDMYNAGTNTASNTVLWCVFGFLEYPEHQEKIYSEIKRVIGDSKPSMAHLAEMNYTAAFIHEIMRHRTMVPTSVPHTTTEHVKFKQYEIPNGTTVIPNIWAVHHDPELFKKPDEFNPQRFIDSEGKFKRSPHVIPFGVGPRQCLGMELVNMEVFMFITKLVQKFEIIPPKSVKMPSFNDGGGMFTYTPKPFKAVFKPRG